MLYLKELITKETPIISLKNDSSSTEKEKSEILGTNYASYSLSRKKDYLKMMYKINNDWYYFKEENDSSYYLMEELMGSFLANKIESQAVTYSIASRKEKKNPKQFGLASKNFKKPEFDYYFCDFYREIYYLQNGLYDYENIKNIENLKIICKTEEETERLIEQVLKMLALDLFMLQKDRNGANIQFQINKKNDQISLAPLYDFSKCAPKIEKDGIYLKNYIIRITEKTLHKLIKQYPVFQSYLSILLEIGFLSVWEEICETYSFCRSGIAYEQIKKYYETKEESQRKELSLYLKRETKSQQIEKQGQLMIK